MLTSLFYPLPLLFNLALNTSLLWLIFISSAGLNLYLLNKNKKLKAQLDKQQKVRDSQDPVSRNKSLGRSHKKTLKKLINSSSAINISDSSLAELEAELDKSIVLDASNSDGNIVGSITVEQPVLSIQSTQERIMQNILQSMSGWHKSLVPFLMQNIGWFIGILCFISGSVFFISYTDGFTKTVTIFYTILSYTLLLAWGGYRLKEKVTHASVSGNILLAISFLLIPLNFSAAARLILSSTGSTESGISLVSTVIAMVILFYNSKLISGVLNRQFLSYFSTLFFSLSAVQLIVPVVHVQQSIILLLGLQVVIVVLLLAALIYYLPTLLEQVIVDREYLLLFSAGSLIYAALVSTIHITLSSPLIIALSYYAPVLILLSAALFYIDGQLNEYKTRAPLLSRFSFISYAVSFLAIFLSFDSEWSRIITMSLACVLYARLLWLYRSLVPLYLVILLLSFLHADLLLLNGVYPGSDFITEEQSLSVLNLKLGFQWYYLASLPLLGLFSAALFFLRKSEIQRGLQFAITHHLLHFIMLVSIVLSLFSQYFITSMSMAFSNSFMVILSCYYLLESNKITARKLMGIKPYIGYLYLLLFIPVILILISSEALIIMDSKILFLTFIALLYSINSHFRVFRFSCGDVKIQGFYKEWFINTSLLISFLLLILLGSGFSLSIKIAALLFILSLNFLFLSMVLYNRALFYAFLLISSLSVLTIKLYLKTSPSTGLLVISFTFILFYFIHWLDKNRVDETETLKSKISHKNSPEKILWFYPIQDFSIDVTSKVELHNGGNKNVQV